MAGIAMEHHGACGQIEPGRTRNEACDGRSEASFRALSRGRRDQYGQLVTTNKLANFDFRARGIPVTTSCGDSPEISGRHQTCPRFAIGAPPGIRVWSMQDRNRDLGEWNEKHQLSWARREGTRGDGRTRAGHRKMPR